MRICPGFGTARPGAAPPTARSPDSARPAARSCRAFRTCPEGRGQCPGRRRAARLQRSRPPEAGRAEASGGATGPASSARLRTGFRPSGQEGEVPEDPLQRRGQGPVVAQREAQVVEDGQVAARTKATSCRLGIDRGSGHIACTEQPSRRRWSVKRRPSSSLGCRTSTCELRSSSRMRRGPGFVPRSSVRRIERWQDGDRASAVPGPARYGAGAPKRATGRGAIIARPTLRGPPCTCPFRL